MRLAQPHAMLMPSLKLVHQTACCDSDVLQSWSLLCVQDMYLQRHSTVLAVGTAYLSTLGMASMIAKNAYHVHLSVVFPDRLWRKYCIRIFMTHLSLKPFGPVKKGIEQM